MPNKKKKKFNSRFPPTRIKRIMQTDEDVGKVAAAVPVIISPRALELFVESLIKNASQITRTRNAKTLTTTHLKQCILAENKFDFLRDLVASVPDVQGDDDSSNPPPTSTGDLAAVKGPANLIHKYKRVPRVRKFGRGNAGPSQLDDDEDDEEDDDDDDDEDEEDDDDDDDEDEDGSEDSLPATKAQPSCGSNHVPMISTSGTKTATTTTAPPPNGTQPSVNAIASNVCNFAGARSASQLDEDYDS